MSFKPDYGLQLLEEGVSPSIDLFFHSLRLYSVTLLGEGQYSTTGEFLHADELYALSLDFDDLQLAQILAGASEHEHQTVMTEVARDPTTPRTIELNVEVVFGVRARLGQIQMTPYEQFVPLIVHEVL